jgi:hypothetical protein
MHLIDVGFRTGIDLSLQHLPTGEQYVYLPDAECALERAREQVVTSGVRLWGEHGDVVPVIDIALETVRGGQHQVLLRKDDYSSLIPPDELDTIFDILAAVA